VPSKRPSLQGIRLSRSFGSGSTLTRALREASLKVHQGEFAVVMGPSGGGKSTLLAVLSGLLRPDSGQVLVRGTDLWRLTERERRRFRLENFGFIFQGFNLFPALTAREQIEMVLRWGEGTSRREAEKCTADMLELLGIGAKGDLLPAELSGGEKQRVAIGRALIKKPAFVFADEPTSALDWTHGQQVVELLSQAARWHGATVLVVTHDARLTPYAQRVFHLEDGYLTESAPADELLPQRIS
jgi:putative ABC transport system ATP-binding protein